MKVETPKATAVKAKAVPPKTEHTQNATAVHECLARSSTAEIEQAAQQANESRPRKEAQEPSKATTTQTSQQTLPPPAPPASEKGSGMDPEDKENNENQGEEESSSSEDSEERRAKEEQLQAKKEARARYMRFHRSLYSTLVILKKHTPNS